MLLAPGVTNEMEPAMRPFEELGHRGQVSRLRHLVEEALAAYDVRPVRMAPLRRGDNVVFRLETADGQRYALRIHRVGGNPWHPRRTAAHVESELTWLAALRHETDLVVPEPVPNRLGALLTIAEIEGVPEPRSRVYQSREFVCSCGGSRDGSWTLVSPLGTWSALAISWRSCMSMRSGSSHRKASSEGG
jgi:hypothetical protein